MTLELSVGSIISCPYKIHPAGDTLLSLFPMKGIQTLKRKVEAK